MQSRLPLFSRFGLLVAALVLVAPLATAQTRSVYGSGVDEDAALVRFVNAGSSDAGSKRLGAQVFAAGARGSATPYKPVYPDVYVFEAGGRNFEFLPESGAFYTIALVEGGAVVFRDEKHADPAKAQLYFYQLGPGSGASLMTADGKVAVTPSLAYGRSAQVAVNAVAARLAVFAGPDRASGELAVSLERGASFAVFYAPAGGPSAFVVKASVSSD